MILRFVWWRRHLQLTTLDTMPHGDMSDICGVALIAAGGQLLMYPGVVKSSEWIYPRATHENGPLADPVHTKILSLVAAFEIMLGCILITVRVRQERAMLQRAFQRAHTQWPAAAPRGHLVSLHGSHPARPASTTQPTRPFGPCWLQECQSPLW